MTDRNDLIEISDVLNGSGLYVSDWFDSAYIESIIAVAGISGNSVALEVHLSADGVNELADGAFVSGTPFTPFRIPTRYFRFRINLSAHANANFTISARKVT